MFLVALGAVQTESQIIISGELKIYDVSAAHNTCEDLYVFQSVENFWKTSIFMTKHPN